MIRENTHHKIMENQKKGQNKKGRLGRFKDRNRARKKAMNSWDRDLSIGNVKWGVWGLEWDQIKIRV